MDSKKEKPDTTDIQVAIACINDGQELDEYMKPWVIKAIAFLANVQDIDGPYVKPTSGLS